MQASRRVVFNPTSVPSLRQSETQRRDIYNASRFVRPGLSGVRNNGALFRNWRVIRHESTETGEDKTGHIFPSSNEGILFFDSQSNSNTLLLLKG